MARLYALLVGINEYQAVTPLHGCVSDIGAVEALLRERVHADTLDVVRLIDGEATRARIIDGFRSHLKRAGAGDTALFYYCGHGSEEACPPEWRHVEPSGRNQTLVPVDARVGDIFDLADKELNALIGEVASGGAHVVTMFDSCHSGGVTRDVSDLASPDAGVARMTAASKGRARSLADYLEEARVLYDADRIATQGPPAPRHVAVAACQHNETAKEIPTQPPRRGAFTSAFEEAARALGPSATYLDLVTALRMKVRDRAKEQLPSLDTVGGARGTDTLLGGHAGRSDLTVDADASGRWWISAGAIDGIPAPASGAVVEVSIYPRGAFDLPGVTPAPIARATVDAVLEDRARLQLTVGAAALDPAGAYLGAIARLGVTPLHVRVDGTSSDMTDRVRAQLQASAVFFSVVEQPSSTPLVTVRVGGDAIELVGEDGVALPGLRYPLTDDELGFVASDCTHLAKWYGLRDRTPAGSRFNGAVALELVPVAANEKRPPEDRAPHAPLGETLQLRYDGAEAPRVQMRLRNTSDTRLYVALLDLDDAYGCSTLFADWIPPRSVAYAAGGRAFRLKVMDWRDPSVRVVTDWFKLFAATTQFDADHLQLAALVGPSAVRVRAAIAEDDDEDDSTWGTTRLKVEITR